MQKFRVTGTLFTVGAGIRLGLSEAQAKVRMHNLEGRGGTFTAINPVQFKHGEMFSMEAANFGKADIGRIKAVGGEPLPSPAAAAPQLRRDKPQA